MACSCHKLAATTPPIHRGVRRRQQVSSVGSKSASIAPRISSSQAIEPLPLEILRLRDDLRDPDLLWLPFLEYMIERINLRFAPNFRNHTEQLEQEWACRKSNGKKAAVIASWEYSAPPKLARIRFSYMTTESSLQALNCVIYPANQRSKQLFLDVFEEFKHVHQPPNTNIYPDTKFFSDALLLCKGRKSQEMIDLAWSVMRRYMETFLSLASHCAPDTASELVQHRIGKQNEYDEWQREHDPVEAVLSAYFGKEWAKRYTGEFCYRGGHGVSERFEALP